MNGTALLLYTILLCALLGAAGGPYFAGPSHNPSDTGTIVRHPGPATPEPTEETP